MGTKLEFLINFLATSANRSSSGSIFSVDQVNDFFNTMSGADKFQGLMSKMLEKGDVESIRNTMQVHEDVFKNQVKELHRLYNVQKMLMEEVRKEIKQNNVGGFNLRLQSTRDDPSSRERSGSCSGDNMRISSRGFDLERPAEEDMSTGVSGVNEDQAGPSSRVVCRNNETKIVDGYKEDSEVELTLSIGGSLTKKRSSKSYTPLTHKNTRENDSSVSFKSERGGGECSDPTTPMSSSSATCDQETKRPHWLFQGLKL